MEDAVGIAEEILELKRRLERLPDDHPSAAAIRATITERRARLSAVTRVDAGELRRRLDALRAEAERIRVRRIDVVKQVGGGAAGGAGWDGPVTQWLNTRMDSAAGLPDIERKIAELERLLEEST